MEDKIRMYRFLPTEVKDLNYNQLKIFSIIRQFSIDNVSRVDIKELQTKSKIDRNNIYNIIKQLVAKGYIGKSYDEFEVYRCISGKTQFLWWTDSDLDLNLTYNQFVLYCLIRTNSNKLGHAMFKQKTISDMVGIDISNISKAIKQLVNKGLIRIEKQDTFTKYWIIEKSKYEDCIDSTESVEQKEIPQEIQQIIAEDKKEQTIYDRVASIFGWDKLPKIGIDLINAAYQTYNDNRVNIGTIIYGCLDKAKYTITTNAEFKNNSAEFVYWWKCAETEIKKSYTGRIRSLDTLDKMAAAEAQEDEEERKRIEAFKKKRYDEMRNENNEEAWFADEIDY